MRSSVASARRMVWLGTTASRARNQFATAGGVFRANLIILHHLQAPAEGGEEVRWDYRAYRLPAYPPVLV